jgi:Fe-S-cluster-containing hydrogenase component 2/CRP-like cAMP-binding protein
VAIAGRSRGSLARLARLFTRRTQTGRTTADAASLGEISPYATLHADRPPPPLMLEPGDVFGIDACVNFFPREATVRADERCVVLEMLRSVVDAIRDAGAAGSRLDTGYGAAAIRNQLALTPWLHGLADAERAELAETARLLTPDDVRDGVVYREGDAADAVFLVRSGTIKLGRQRGGGEFIFAYLGRGAACGFEPVLAAPPAQPLRLVCTSHPALGGVDLGRAVTIGRGAGCDLRLPHEARTISKRHCRFEERDGDVFLVDLDSANFTLLNGERVREAMVAEGDRITLVDYEFEVQRPLVEDTAVGAVPRLATATGLDNFELVRLDGARLRRVAGANLELREALGSMARAVEAPVPEPIVPDSGAIPSLVELNLYNAQNALLIDLDRCTRCDECVRACADAHGGVTRFTRDGPRFGKYLVTLACRSCTDPKCMIGCPVGSIRRSGSLEIRIEPWCIGCQTCANQCPFGNINMVELATPPPGAMSTPALRATVCDLCAGFDGPNCVYACPHDAAIRVNPASFLAAGDLR